MVDNSTNTPLVPISPTVSLVGSVTLFVAGALVGWLATHNIIPAADVAQDTAVISSIIGGILAAGVAYFKMKQATPNALITQVNADKTNGVKVVLESTVAPTATQAITPSPTLQKGK